MLAAPGWGLLSIDVGALYGEDGWCRGGQQLRKGQVDSAATHLAAFEVKELDVCAAVRCDSDADVLYRVPCRMGEPHCGVQAEQWWGRGGARLAGMAEEGKVPEGYYAASSGCNKQLSTGVKDGAVCGGVSVGGGLGGVGGGKRCDGECKAGGEAGPVAVLGCERMRCSRSVGVCGFGGCIWGTVDAHAGISPPNCSMLGRSSGVWHALQRTNILHQRIIGGVEVKGW